MFAEFKRKVLAPAVRVMGTICVLAGGALVVVMLIGVQTLFVLGMSLWALAAHSTAAPEQEGQPVVLVAN